MGVDEQQEPGLQQSVSHADGTVGGAEGLESEETV